MNYEIIKDENMLKSFIGWLPELKCNEIYYLSLFARKKYCTELQYSKTDKTQLKRFTSDKERMLIKIKQLECEIGSYFLKNTVAPQESLALYITINPRNQITASRNMLIKLARLIGEPYNGHNLHQISLSEIQKAKSSTKWVDFDIDTEKSSNFVINAKNCLDRFMTKDSYKILETHGGYHILVDPKQQHNKHWYNMIIENFSCDVVGDNMIPIVGCAQGDFVPKFID